MNDLSRRELLAGTAAVSLATAASNATAQPRPLPLPPGVPKEVPATLECGFVSLDPKLFEGKQIRGRAYNGTIPGPLLRLYPGQDLTITIKNSLPLYRQSDWPPPAQQWPGDHNVPHALGSTNLHLHGMDVIPHLFEPLGTSIPNAPMISIPPGGTYTYKFKIPDDHPPGFNWYHPHHHGSTAVQAVTGMAGGIVVFGAIDEVPEIKQAAEYFLVINDLGLFQTDPSLNPAALGLPPGTDISNYWTYLPKQNAIWQTFGVNDANGKFICDVSTYNPKSKAQEPSPNLKAGFTTGDYALRYYLVNGAPFFKEEHNPANPTHPTGTQMAVPQFKMASGEVARFRMLNANSDNLMPIAVEAHDVHLLALDGVNFDRVRTIKWVPFNNGTPSAAQLELAPANRAEFMIKAGPPGTYKIVQLAQDQQFLFSEQKTIAEIVVSSDVKDMKLPTNLPPQTRYRPIAPKEVDRLQVLYFADAFPGTQNPYVGIDFTLNGQQYVESEVNYVVDRDSVEEWHLVVGDSQHGGTEGHPFHIHVNPFEVISINGAGVEPGTFKDTIWIPKQTTVIVRQRFREFVGKSVFHCHILPHEDTGMMQNFLIKPRGEPLPAALFEGRRGVRLHRTAEGTAPATPMSMPGHGGHR